MKRSVNSLSCSRKSPASSVRCLRNATYRPGQRARPTDEEQRSLDDIELRRDARPAPAGEREQENAYTDRADNTPDQQQPVDPGERLRQTGLHLALAPTRRTMLELVQTPAHAATLTFREGPRSCSDAEGADNLCDLLVFVQEASGPIAPADAEGFEVDDVVGHGPERRGLGQGSVRAVVVVQGLVLA